MERALLVGWSYGGILTWHWTDRNPDRVLRAVTVAAFPVGLTGEEGHARIRKLFRRMRWLFPIAARLGLAAKMTADQHADVNIELNEFAAASITVLDRLTRPVRFVLATGDSLGSKGGEMDEGRKVLEPIIARNPNITISAKVASNHSKILRNDSPTVAQTIRALAAGHGYQDG
ncbi:hypothetical protein KUA19_39715 [Catellatospora sp. NEAU-YM18]|nr:hypothetical protein [Catellatospora tritici]